MAIKIRPVAGRILLRVVPEQTESVVDGIVVRGKRRDGYREAVVQALPAGYRGDLGPGVFVLLPPYKGTEVIINRERLVFVRESELEAALEE